MKRRFFIILFLLIIDQIIAQGQNIDSLRNIINQQRGDMSEVDACVTIGNQFTQFDSIIYYAQQGLELAKKINYKKGEADCLFLFTQAYINVHNYRQIIAYDLKAMKIYKEIKDTPNFAECYFPLQGSYRDIGDLRKSLDYSLEGLYFTETYRVKGTSAFSIGNFLAPLIAAEVAQTYLDMNQLDSALFYLKKSRSEKAIINGAEWNFPVYLQAKIKSIRGDHKEALTDYRLAIRLTMQNAGAFFRDTLQIFSGMSSLFTKLGQLDSAIYYATQVEISVNPTREVKVRLDALNTLANAYKLKNNKDSALKYVELGYTVRDSLFSNEKNREIQNMTFNDRLRQQEIESEQARYRNRIQRYALISGLLVLILITGILWRNNKQQQKAKSRIEQAYTELKSTQQQLIQSEKMASLGELTAGIAHEIQNPLNFVNNFSEVNNELIEEVKNQKSKLKNEEIDELLNDIFLNNEKINHHGKRADAIVKGMLQHSRSSSGVKEPTDINALADEYLRLAYHGLRAKDKSFNAITITNFDNSIGKIYVVPQEIGRVILNLINNAFYAVDEKQKHASTSSALNGYEPTVIVSTRTVKPPSGDLGAKVEIKVADNGNGIPQKVLDKIFQPFFTTKPTGQGTGLGLSLSYDTVKAHGGEIKVETKEGEGSEFIILLPVI
jgi:signal transduction histidine kinase